MKGEAIGSKSSVAGPTLPIAAAIVCGGPHASNSRSPGGPRERVSQTGGYNLAFMFDLD